jgi:serine/threonine protein kinase
MPAATATVQQMVQLMSKARLASADDARAAQQRWQAEARGSAEDADAFRKFLVERGYATEYQATLLAAGAPGGYFVDQYKILERIDKVRNAGVYKGQHPSGQFVALKVLTPSKVKDATTLARFQREARLSMQLAHPNVLRTLHVGEWGGAHFMVMEYLEGETLEDVLARRGRLPSAEAIRVAHQALLGLQHVFEKGMVHRDVKPANIMLVPGKPAFGPDTTAYSTVKLLDIGLGRALFDEPGGEGEQQLTADGTLLGTPDYLAPEQARSAHAADIRADIYSLGCVLYQALTGKTPFPDKNVLTQILRHATELPRPIAEFGTDAPEGLQPVLNWMMAKDPNQRYPTPERAAMALEMFLPAEAPPPPVATAATPPPMAVPEAPPSAPVVPGEIPTGRLVTDRKRSRDPAERRPAAARRREEGAGEPYMLDEAPRPADEYDVELVPVPLPGTTPEPLIAPRPGRAQGDDRPLTELHRRDFIMLGAGGAGVLIAILGGYGLAQAFRRKKEPIEPDTKPEKPKDKHDQPDKSDKPAEG